MSFGSWGYISSKLVDHYSALTQTEITRNFNCKNIQKYFNFLRSLGTRFSKRTARCEPSVSASALRPSARPNSLTYTSLRALLSAPSPAPPPQSRDGQSSAVKAHMSAITHSIHTTPFRKHCWFCLLYYI